MTLKEKTLQAHIDYQENRERLLKARYAIVREPIQPGGVLEETGTEYKGVLYIKLKRKYENHMGMCVIQENIPIAEAIAIRRASFLTVPEWLSTPAEPEKKYKYVLNPTRYLNWCIENKCVPVRNIMEADLSTAKMSWHFLDSVCDKVEIKENTQ
jgi:hypothetical protein